MNLRNANDVILKMSKEKKYHTLKDESFRKELFKEENHYPFVWLVQSLKNEELLYLLDDNIIPLLNSDSRKVDKLNAIMTCGNHVANEFLKKEEIIKAIIASYDRLYNYMYDLDLSFAKELFKYIIRNNLPFDYLNHLSSKVQLEIIKQNIDIIKEKEVTINFILDLQKDTTEYLLNDSYFENILLNARVDDIAYIIKKGVTLPVSLQTNKTIINKFIAIEDINNFYDYVNSLDDNIYLKEEIIGKRREIYTKKINNIDLNLNIFTDYLPILEGQSNFTDFSLNYEVSKLRNDKDKLLTFLQEVTVTKMLEMTIDTFYQDLTYNFLKNVESMLLFITESSEDIIPKERLKIYNSFIDYYNLTMAERISLYNELNNGHNHMEDFYDDFRTCKDKSYSQIKNSLINLKEKQKTGKINGIDVYKYDGEPFKMLISVINYYRGPSPSSDIIWWESKKVTSLSLISDKNITTFGNPNDEVILGFDGFNPDNIMITYHADAYTNETGSPKVSKLYTPDSLIDATKTYNEIQISEKYEHLQPSYVVCYDEITEGDIEASKLLGGIPLIVIDTKKYIFKKEGFVSPDEDKYKHPSELYGKNSYRTK